MKQLRVIVQVRNNLLQQRREELGMNQAELCRAAGVQQSFYAALELMRKSPFGINGKWRESVLKIGEKFQVSRERIRQIEERALGKMRKELEAK